MKSDFKYQVKNGAIASHNDFHSGIIVTIDKVGLSFRYLAFKDEKNGTLKNPETVTILHYEGFSINDIACIVVDAYIIPEIYISTGNMKVCKIHFTELTKEQESKLDYFIAQYTYRPTKEDISQLAYRSKPFTDIKN